MSQLTAPHRRLPCRHHFSSQVPNNIVGNGCRCRTSKHQLLNSNLAWGERDLGLAQLTAPIVPAVPIPTGFPIPLPIPVIKVFIPGLFNVTVGA
ncbi:hypothetical protein TIFTF001_042379 [Ficus carica]|uniref:Uncharacterized protein n=1 Tax=Ficus carica TaxID=3494 RepID=A0AA87ZZ08_FICCA|nr:hypothetical protein TIFTF001_042379 [Ficus carica]